MLPYRRKGSKRRGQNVGQASRVLWAAVASDSDPYPGLVSYDRQAKSGSNETYTPYRRRLKARETRAQRSDANHRPQRRDFDQLVGDGVEMAVGHLPLFFGETDEQREIAEAMNAAWHALTETMQGFERSGGKNRPASTGPSEPMLHVAHRLFDRQRPQQTFDRDPFVELRQNVRAA